MAFATSEQYAPYLAVTIHSIAQQASPARRYEIIVLHEGLKSELQQRLRHVAASAPNVTVRPVQAGQEIWGTIQQFDSACNWPKLVFYRLFLAELFPEYDKIIFMGVDTLVRHDPAALWDTPLGERALAAVADVAAPVNAPWRTTLRNLRCEIPDPYFNSDVQLQNLRVWRERGIGRQTFDLLLQYRFPLLEQDALNQVLAGEWIELGTEWNYQLPQFQHFCPQEYASLPEEDRVAGESILRAGSYKIIHYPGAKPWTLPESGPAPLADLWWQTALATPGFEDYFARSLHRQLAALADARRKHRLRSLLAVPRVRQRRLQKIRGISESMAFYGDLLRNASAAGTP